MANIFRSNRKHSLVRRILTSIASLALIGGTGWAAFHYYPAELLAGEAAEADTQVAHSATTAKAELKLLFASESKQKAAKKGSVKTENSQPTAQLASKSTASRYDRYTPARAVVLPVTKSTQLAVSPYVAKASNPDRNDRYATAPVMATKSTTDVARGQEPSGPLDIVTPPANNPFASSSSSSTGNEARAAFGAALIQSPKTRTSTPAATNHRPADMNAALNQARPLRANAVDSASGRYSSAPTQPTSSQPTSTLPTSSLPIFAAESPVPTPAIPAPALQIQTPNTFRQSASQPRRIQPRQTLPVQSAAALGAPPANMQSGRLAMATPTRAALQPQLPQAGLTATPSIASLPGTGRPGERLLEGAQSPAITIQKLAPAEIQVGKRCTFAIRIQNTGQRTAHNVQIRDEVPLGTEFVGTAPRASVSGSEIIWDLGTLSPGEERTVEMELMPKEEGELGSVATVSFAAQASAKSRCTRPELALRLTSSPQVHLGEQHIVQIEVSNPGSGDATNVMLLETIPTGVSHQAGPALEFEIGTLEAGETRRLDLLLTAEQAGRINNVMTAQADASLQVEAGCEFEVIAPELQLSVTGPKRRFLERPATYRVSVNNPGTAAAKDVQLVTHLPQGLQFVSANNMGEYDSATHSVHWSLAKLPASEQGTVELVALPIEAGTQTLKIETKAEQGLEDRTDKQVLVEGLSAIMFEVIDVEGLIEVGGETTYEIRVQNQGSKAATNVQIVAIMPPGIRPISGQGETRHVIQGERVVFAPLPQLAPKAETTFRIQVQGVRPGDQRVRVQVTTDDHQQPITKEVSTRVYADDQ